MSKLSSLSYYYYLNSYGSSNSLFNISKVSNPNILLLIYVNLCNPPYKLSKSLYTYDLINIKITTKNANINNI